MQKTTVLALLAIAMLGSAPMAAFGQSSAADDASLSSVLHVDYAAIKTRYAHAKWTFNKPAGTPDLYPVRAMDAETPGVAKVACFIEPDGHISRCVILSEAPVGYGFGVATANLYIKYTKVDPATVEGGIQPGDVYVFTYNWKLS